MSNVIRSLVIKVGADLSDMQKGLNKAAKELKTAGKEMTNLGSSLTTGLTLPIVGAGVASIKYASDLNESLNKVEVAFKGSAQDVEGWAKTTLNSYGIAQGSALDLAATFGDMGTAMGQTPAQAAVMSKSLVGLAGDLASFKNISIDQAQTALKGIYTGEGEALKSLGIVMQDSTLKAYALATGQKKTYDQMTQGEKVALRYAYVMSVTGNAQGDFARTSDGTANQLRVFQESLKELASTFGTNLLPVITPFIKKLNEGIKWLGSLDKTTQKNIITFAGLLAALGPTLMIVGKLTTSLGGLMKGLSGAAGVLKGGGGLISAFGALIGPGGIALLVIAAIAAAAFLIITNWDSISKFFTDLWASVSKAFTDAWTNISNFFTVTIPTIVGNIISWFAALPGNIANFFNELPGKIGYALGYVTGTFIRWGANTISWVTTEIPKIILSIGNFFWQLPGKVWNALTNVVNGIGTWISNMINKITIEVPKVIRKIGDFFWELPGKMVEIGGNIIKGLWDGIKNSANWLWNKLGDFCNGIVQGFKDGLGIHSPSTVMQSLVGKWIPAGIAKGMIDNKGFISNAMDSLNSELTVSPMLKISGEYNGMSGSTSSALNNTSGTNIYNNYGAAQEVTVLQVGDEIIATKVQNKVSVGMSNNSLGLRRALGYAY